MKLQLKKKLKAFAKKNGFKLGAILMLFSFLLVPIEASALSTDGVSNTTYASTLQVIRNVGNGASYSYLQADLQRGVYFTSNPSGVTALTLTANGSNSINITSALGNGVFTFLFPEKLVWGDTTLGQAGMPLFETLPTISIYNQLEPDAEINITFSYFESYLPQGVQFDERVYTTSLTFEETSAGSLSSVMMDLYTEALSQYTPDSEIVYITNISVEIDISTSSDIVFNLLYNDISGVDYSFTAFDSYYDIGYADGFEYAEELYGGGQSGGFNPISWLLTALDSLLAFPLIRYGTYSLTIGTLLGVSLSVPLLIWFLKLFAGG